MTYAALASTLNGQSKQAARAYAGVGKKRETLTGLRAQIAELKQTIILSSEIIARQKARIEQLEKGAKLAPGEKLTLEDSGWVDAKTFAYKSRVSLATVSRRFDELKPYGAYQDENNGRLWIPAHCEALGKKPRGKRKNNSGSAAL